MSDNDPKHTFKTAQQFLEINDIYILVEGTGRVADLNPIENLWHELKEYVRRYVKPKTKELLLSCYRDSSFLENCCYSIFQ